MIIKPHEVAVDGPAFRIVLPALSLATVALEVV